MYRKELMLDILQFGVLGEVPEQLVPQDQIRTLDALASLVNTSLPADYPVSDIPGLLIWMAESAQGFSSLAEFSVANLIVLVQDLPDYIASQKADKRTFRDMLDDAGLTDSVNWELNETNLPGYSIEVAAALAVLQAKIIKALD
jgi:hypothetical protein